MRGVANVVANVVVKVVVVDELGLIFSEATRTFEGGILAICNLGSRVKVSSDQVR